jgi:hypothetical protein
MHEVGQTYRPAGPLDLKSILTTLILGTVVAAFGAVLVWAWEISPVPTLVIFTPLIQGILIGLALSLMIGRLHLRSPKLVGLVGFLCGLLSVVFVHYGHHLELEHQIAASLRQDIRNPGIPEPGEKAMTAADRKAVLAKLDADPNQVADSVVFLQTGHHGFLGTMMMRAQAGVQIKSMDLTGTGVWILWGLEALLVAFTTASMASSRAGEPYCEDCRLWHTKRPNVLSLDGGHVQALSSALQTDDHARIPELRAKPPETPGDGQVDLTMYSCDNCGQSYADTSQTIQKGKDTKTRALLKRVGLSPEMVSVLVEKAESGAEEVVEQG